MARVVVQRVQTASVEVDGVVVGEIGHGLAILLGIGRQDTAADVHRLADKVARLRIFADDQGKMNRSVTETGGATLVISQFTLYGDATRGRRPSFTGAADPATGKLLYEQFCLRLQFHGLRVAQGRFGAHMTVDLSNDGPVTLVLDSDTV